ncbi:protein Smaug homolog 1 isoform X15 [Sminthopsis crassicaudata]|uniref:protein Smaug homolog 1 isoform X15 n=1 Tax=Sminthopsis crassicaudata TaxID=9301 RepID=UPI003D696E12
MLISSMWSSTPSRSAPVLTELTQEEASVAAAAAAETLPQPPPPPAPSRQSPSLRGTGLRDDPHPRASEFPTPLRTAPCPGTSDAGALARSYELGRASPLIMMFRDQVGVLAGWFKGWNECEQTVALLSLLKRVSRTQARFLQICLEHSLADCTELHILEGEANNPVLSGQAHHSPLKRSVSLTPPMNVPNQPLGHGWMSHEDLRARGPQCIPSDHAPLSPQSSVASSGSGGSEHLEDQTTARNTFQEEGSGMKDVPAWLKSLRLHKYAALFSQMTYEEMMALTECQLEAQNVTKGARHKIVISIQKLKERQNLLKSLERDILEGGNLRVPLQELHQMILTPIKAYCSQSSNTEEHSQESEPHHQPTLIGSDNQALECKDSAAGGGIQQHHMSGCEGESAGAPLPEGDLPGQFTRVMGKVCTQLLVSRPDEENISSYLQLIDKCLIHEAFTETQKKRLLSWKQQVQKLFRSFPRKTLLDISGYRQQRNRGFGQSNSLPTAGSVGGGMGRRNPRQYQIPSRNLPSARLGLLGTSGFISSTQRSSATNPTILKQGRQNLWFANPGGSNSMPSRTHSSVQRTRSLPVHSSPQTMLMFQQQEFQVPVTEPDINNRLESLCLSMTEHALGDENIETQGDARSHLESYSKCPIQNLKLSPDSKCSTLSTMPYFFSGVHSCLLDSINSQLSMVWKKDSGIIQNG